MHLGWIFYFRQTTWLERTLIYRIALGNLEKKEPICNLTKNLFLALFLVFNPNPKVPGSNPNRVSFFLFCFFYEKWIQFNFQDYIHYRKCYRKSFFPYISDFLWEATFILFFGPYFPSSQDGLTHNGRKRPWCETRPLNCLILTEDVRDKSYYLDTNDFTR